MLALTTGNLAFAPAAAMAPPMRAVRSSSVQMGVTDMVGISTETGNKLWDPLKLSANMDEANLNLIRAAEVSSCAGFGGRGGHGGSIAADIRRWIALRRA